MLIYKTDEIFERVVQRLQREGILNTRRRVRFQYAECDREELERSVAEKLDVNSIDVIRDFESYANADVCRPMSEYVSKAPQGEITFPARLFRAYFPIGRSGTVEVHLESVHFSPNDKVTAKNIKKIEKIQKELREELKNNS